MCGVQLSAHGHPTFFGEWNICFLLCLLFLEKPKWPKTFELTHFANTWLHAFEGELEATMFDEGRAIENQCSWICDIVFFVET